MSETPLSASIANAIESLGYPVVRLHSGTRSGGRMFLNRPGVADRCVLLRNQRVLWIEVKDKDGKERESQAVWRERVERAGHVVVIVRSVGEAIAAVRAADRRQG